METLEMPVIESKKSYMSTRQLVMNVPVPPQTRTYKPITHSQLMDLTLEGIESAGFVLDQEMYTLSGGGDKVTGRYTIKSINDNDIQLMLAWQNSYDKTQSLKFAIGAHVFICGNGMVVGDMGTFKKKHMGEIQTFAPSRIAGYISDAGEIFENIAKEKEQLKNVSLGRTSKAEILGRMFIEEDIITATQLSIIKKEIQAPTYNYNTPDSGWELYNYITYSLKETHPSLWMKQHMQVHNFFKSTFLN